MIQNSNPGMATATVNWDAPSAADNSGPQELTSSHRPGVELAIGETTVTYTATDSSGNIDTQTFLVTITGKKPG